MTSSEPFPLSEPALVGSRLPSRLRSRNDVEFRKFYDEAADGVFRALALALNDADLAQEATNEAMIRVFQKWRRVRQYDSPAGWAYRVGLNWARGQLRKTKRELLTDQPRLAGTKLSTVESIGEIAPQTDLRRALAELGLDARSVVVLRYLLGWSTAETAAALGVAEGTVKSRLSRALADLETALKDRHE